MRKKYPLFILFFCLFIVPFDKKGLAAPKELDRDDSKKTSFKLKENPSGLMVGAENLSFGTHEITSSDIKEYSEEDMLVSIIDTRGTRDGWSLKLKFDEFKDNNRQIYGAQLFFPQVVPETLTEGEAKKHPPISTIGDTSIIGSNQGKLITVNGSNNVIATANRGSGYGEWLLNYEGNQRVQLRVPGNQSKGDYVATLTYSFESVP